MARFFQPKYSECAIDLDEVCFVGPVVFVSHDVSQFNIVMRSSGQSITIKFSGNVTTSKQAAICREILINNLTAS